METTFFRRCAVALLFIPSLLFAFSGGDGSAGNPFQITTAAQLDSVRLYCGIADSGKYFKLMNDIDLTTWLSPGNPGYNDGAFWLPIGRGHPKEFYGTFNGNSHKVSGLKIRRINTDSIGLFGSIGIGGKLQNIGVEIRNGDTVLGQKYVGGLAGCNDSGMVNNSYCHATGPVCGKIYTGGLVGRNSGSISNSNTAGMVMGITGSIYLGGLIGYNSYGIVCNSYATGMVNGAYLVGGLVGVYYYGTMNNCSSTGAVSGTQFIGGLVGGNTYGLVNNSYASGAVSGVDQGVGGLMGDQYYGSVSNSYATGAVSGTTHIGGLVGKNFKGTVRNCFATGAVIGIDTVGGLVGWNSGTVSNSYWDKQTTGQDTSFGSIPSFGKTTAQMKTQSTFVGWDFAASWAIKTGINAGYPYLQWQIPTDFIGTWTGQGVYCRNSNNGTWVKLGSPADLIAAGDLDGDGTDDLIGIWPGQGGVWVKYSHNGAFLKLASTARHIATGDMNGDGHVDLVGTWDGQGTFYRNSVTGVWVKLGSAATLVTTGDLDGDGSDDLIGIWPSQGGVWVKYSKSGAWAQLSSTALDIATSDMNGDGWVDLIGTWDGQGTYYRNSITGAWVKLGSAATQVTAGDLDGDGTVDLIGIWPSQEGVWVKYSKTGAWERLSSTAVDIATGKVRCGNGIAQTGGESIAVPVLTESADESAQGPGGVKFKAVAEENAGPR
jgi:hypothetical protein